MSKRDGFLFVCIWGFRGAGFANYADGDVDHLAKACCRLVIVRQFPHFLIPYENESMRVGVAGVVRLNEIRFHLCDGRTAFEIVIDDTADAFAFDERERGPGSHCCRVRKFRATRARMRNMYEIPLKSSR